MAEPERPRPDGSAPAGPLPVEEVEARARRLGITLDRVLEQLYAIAFTDIRRVVGWEDGTLTMKASGELLPSDAAAIAEIVASAKDQKIYRVKLHDKTPALALLTSRATMTAKRPAIFSFRSWIASKPKSPPKKTIEFLRNAIPRLHSSRALNQALEEKYEWKPHDSQKPPESDWRGWLLLAGPGFRKTGRGG